MDDSDMTRLAKARIYEVDETGKEKTGGSSVRCMFNPFEYTVTKSNTYEEQPKNNSSVPLADFKKAGASTLTLSLLFDGYEGGQDVTTDTNLLWKLMDVQEGNEKQKIPPPMVAFDWGVFHFVAVITQMTQKFTMFLPNGTPVRARVDVTFTQYKDVTDFPKQSPASGSGSAARVWRVKSTDRLETIAFQVYGDPTRWRLIADQNNLSNPLDLQPGMQLIIPQDE